MVRAEPDERIAELRARRQVELAVDRLGPVRDGTLDRCVRDGTLLLAWSPLGGGRLVGGDGVRPELLSVLDELAAREGVDRSAIALAFVLAWPGRPVAIVGSQDPGRLAGAAPGLLRLLSPASGWTLNDTFANDDKVARRLGRATVTLHPADAAERGLQAGDRCLLANESGRLEVEVLLGEIAPRGVALSPKGRWPKRERESANVNVLNPGHKADMGGSSAVHAIEVSVTAVAR